MDSIKCEKCGHDMVHFETDTCEGMKCTYCDCNWVTTKSNTIYLDLTIYTVTVNKIPEPTKTDLQILSKIFNANILTTLNLIKEGDVTIKGNAIDIKDKIKTLENSQIPFSVTPDFPYSL